MNIHDIIQEIVDTGLLYKLTMNITKGKKYEWFEDLFQDIYLQLLTKDADKLIKIYENGQLKFYLSRILMNSINSNTSDTWRRYRKFQHHSEQLRWDDENDEDDNYDD